MSYVPCDKSQVRILRGKANLKIDKRGNKRNARENIRNLRKKKRKEKNTFPGQDRGCCYGYLSYTTSPPKVNTACERNYNACM